MNEGLKTSLNRIRELSSEIYHQYIPIITDTTDISAFGTPILTVPTVQNEFMNALINRIVYTQFNVKYFRNPLQVLEGDTIPLGYAGQNIHVNPAKGRKYDVNDFAGLLQRYESEVFVEYHAINMDLQYPVTVSRHALKKAFTSWDELGRFVDQLSNSLYNGAYIDEYRFTKALVSGAYQANKVVVEQVSGLSSEDNAKSFIEKARGLFLNFQAPSSNYNAWNKLDTQNRKVVTWTNPEDIVFIIRNDVRAYMDVNVLASAFNMDKTDLLGNIITVDNFDQYDDDGNKIFDGSSVLGIMADKSWFVIKRQDMYLDEFYNANNRTWQYYLNLTKMYNYSLFANAVVFATSLPTVTTTDLTPSVASLTIGEDETATVSVVATPVNTTQDITYTSGSQSVFTVVASADKRSATITGVGTGTANLTIASGSVTKTVSVTVE